MIVTHNIVKLISIRIYLYESTTRFRFSCVAPILSNPFIWHRRHLFSKSYMFPWHSVQGNNTDVSQSADDLACCTALAQKTPQGLPAVDYGVGRNGWMEQWARPTWQGQTCQLYTGKICISGASVLNWALSVINHTDVMIELCDSLQTGIQRCAGQLILLWIKLNSVRHVCLIY